MTATSSRALRLIGSAMALVLPLAASALPASASSGSGGTDLPSARIIRISDHTTWYKTRNHGTFGEATTYVGTRGGAWEIWGQRSNYQDPIDVSQVVRDAAGQVALQQSLPDITMSDFGRGLPDFTTAMLRNSSGEVVAQRNFSFCPNDFQPQRINDKGPETPTYPQFCWSNPFTTGMVWGIDKGWATRSTWGISIRKSLPVGQYQLQIAIASPYREVFNVADEDAVVTMAVDVVRRPSGRTSAGSQPAAPAPEQQNTLTRAASTIPGPEALPDLASLPAWGMYVKNQRHGDHSYLNFGATVWNRGPSPLVVEGFREPDIESMKAYQYFYQDGVNVGRAFAGRLEYDHDLGHDHWHFRDFASYSLLASDKSHIVRSDKEAFCLAPTDMIDLTVVGAALRPWVESLSTACGEVDSLWIREVLQTGWGDTYSQYRPGQSFDVTNLPNGKYFVEVRANPDGQLYEVTDSNNVAYRRIYLRGKAGERRVEVPPYQGIDTERGGSCSQFC